MLLNFLGIRKLGFSLRSWNVRAETNIQLVLSDYL